MNILVLNGSLRPTGHMAAMVTVFAEDARENGYTVESINVYQKRIAALPVNTATPKERSVHSKG